MYCSRYLGRQRASLEENAGSIGNVVEEFVRNLMQMVGETDPRFTGELLPCGSYYEGVKIKRANEFDYIFELSEASGLCQEHVEIRQKKPESMKPKKNTAVYPRAYYTVNFRAGRAPVAWRCRQCDGCRNVGDYQCLLVKATQVLDLFQNRLVSVTSDYNPDWPTPQITQNGPAVTVYTKLDPIHVDQYLSKKGKGSLDRGHPAMLSCKARRQYLLTLQVSRYCLLALQGRMVNVMFMGEWRRPATPRGQ